jgi:hypothetical protein
MHDEKLLNKGAFFATEFPGIQMPRSNNCASLNKTVWTLQCRIGLRHFFQILLP